MKPVWIDRRAHPDLHEAAWRFLVARGAAEDVKHEGTTCLMVVSGEKVLGVVAFHDYRPSRRMVCMTVAFRTPIVALCREMWKEVEDYLSEDMRVEVLQTRISAENRRSIRLHKAAGFSLSRIRNGAGLGKDMYVATLTWEDWRKSVLWRRIHESQGTKSHTAA